MATVMTTICPLPTNNVPSYNHFPDIVLLKKGKRYNYGLELRGTKWKYICKLFHKCYHMHQLTDFTALIKV